MFDTGAKPRRGFSMSKPAMLLLLFLSLFVALPISSAGQSFYFNNRKISIIESTSSSSNSNSTFAVIFDAGSSGSRVHVFHFDQNLDLLSIGSDIEVFSQLKPGLSAYADEPQKAAESLVPLLKIAEDTVPKELHPVTPIRVGATAGLRFLEGDKSEKILEAVRNLLQTNSSFKYESDSVSVLEGIQEGSYQWLTINYLLENLGKTYSETVGVVDLGGGSVQMAYAISDEAAAAAPPLDENTKYIQSLNIKGVKYNLYAHSYLGFGLLASRAAILNLTKNGEGNPCVLNGYEGNYTYAGEVYEAKAPLSGAKFSHCRKVIARAIRLKKPCPYKSCTFDGIWNGGGGLGQRSIYVASFFYDKAAQVGFIDSKAPNVVVRAKYFKKAGKFACRIGYEEAKLVFPNVYPSDLQFVCMDLAYEYELLKKGFNLSSDNRLTLVKQVAYRGSLAEAAWPLGNAVALVSSLEQSNSTAI